MAELISVIVTTYNRDDALDAVLRSLAAQSDADFEVVVADDGSGPATAELVNSWKPKIGRRLEHVWHNDRGFRAAEIRNRAILAARGAYCIFLDGDCIVRPDFVATHRRLAEPGWFVTGNRVLLSRELTTRVLRERLAPEAWTSTHWLAERWRGGVNRLSALLHLPLGPLRRIRQRAWQGARSCNLAIWRADLDRVDGFDADYSGWGKEDSDIIVRLLHAGLRRKDGAFATGVIHLWHAEADRSQLSENERKLKGIIAGDRVRAQRGLSSLDEASATPMAVSGAMAQRPTANSIAGGKLESIACGLVVAAAVALPWSTSATAIFAVLWVFALIPTLQWTDIRRELATAAGGLPVLFVGLGIAGMLWADVMLIERWKGLDSFFKLLAIALLFVQFRRSGRADWVFSGYLFSCVTLLVATVVVMAVPPLAHDLLHFDNVLVKNGATQSGEFVTCIFGLLFLAAEAIERQRWIWLFGCVGVILAMLVDILYFTTGRTASRISVFQSRCFRSARASMAKRANL